MADIVSKETRSRMMSGIRGRDTAPELLVRRYLHGKGFRFRLSVRHLPGKPDIVLPKWGVAVFVHGCFWHGHEGCRFFRIPSTRREFWEQKIGRNKARDCVSARKLRDIGWRVAEVWECELRDDPDGTLKALAGFIKAAQSPHSSMS